MEHTQLIHLALRARAFSYAPYSHFWVGAALLGTDGQVYTGCNVENASYGLTNCAERTALFHAVSTGVRTFQTLVVVGGPESATELDYCYPCGICRQALMEFCAPEFLVVVARSVQNYQVHPLGELLAYSFGSKDLGSQPKTAETEG